MRYWREILLAVAIISLVGMCRARDAELRAKGVAEERWRKADSALQELRPKLALADSLLTRRSLALAPRLAKVLHDTLYLDTLYLPGDTTPRFAVPIEVVAKKDSLLRECSVVLNDCEQYKLKARATIRALEDKVAAAPVAQQRSCTLPAVVSGVLGAAAGGVIGNQIRRRP